MSKASRRFKAQARTWNREMEPRFRAPRRCSSLRGYRAHKRRKGRYAEDILAPFQ